jgi:hypothetical protein
LTFPVNLLSAACSDEVVPGFHGTVSSDADRFGQAASGPSICLPPSWGRTLPGVFITRAIWYDLVRVGFDHRHTLSDIGRHIIGVGNAKAVCKVTLAQISIFRLFLADLFWGRLVDRQHVRSEGVRFCWGRPWLRICEVGLFSFGWKISQDKKLRPMRTKSPKLSRASTWGRGRGQTVIGAPLRARET